MSRTESNNSSTGANDDTADANAARPPVPFPPAPSLPLPPTTPFSTPARRPVSLTPSHRTGLPQQGMPVLINSEHKGRDTSTIHLFGVPPSVTDGYLLDLCSRWGRVLSLSRQTSTLVAGTPEITIVFSAVKEAEEGLRHLNGGLLFGSALKASLRSTLLQAHLESFPQSSSPQEEAQQAAGGPRNLYVLNLSLEMTNSELERLFAVFGPVNHVCIMAVLDSLGRRRAFVDMATGEAARQAIATLHGTSIHGYKIDVSFAIVQRSGGPVTDYPPTAYKRAQQASLHILKQPSSGTSAFYRQQLQIQPQTFSPLPHSMGNEMVPYTHRQQLPPFFGNAAVSPTLPSVPVPFSPFHAVSSVQPLDLYVSNLDPVAVVDDDDLAAIFRPYGTVLGAKLAINENGHSIGVGFVRMSTLQEAEMARLHVQGRVMDSKRISVTFSPSMLPSPAFSSIGSPLSSGTYGSPMTPPYAPQWHSTPPQPLANVGQYPVDDVFSSLSGTFAGLGISTSPSADLSSACLPSGLQVHQSRGTTYFTRKPSLPAAPSTTSEEARDARQPKPSASTGYRPEDSLGQSSFASLMSTVHSREGSIETTATSQGGGTDLDIKVVDDSSSDKISASKAQSLASSASSSKPDDVLATASRASSEFGTRSRAVTSEIPVHSAKKPFDGGHRRSAFNRGDSPTARRSSSRARIRARALSRSVSATDVA